MNIYVVSLKNSPRRAAISSRLESLNLNYKFIDAVDKADLPSDLSSFYDQESCVKRHGRPLVPAEVACFLSHIKAWRVMNEESESGIILEDDAKFSSKFIGSISILKSRRFNADVVLLGHSKSLPENERKHYFYNPLKIKDLRGEISIGSVYKLWTSGMVGYYLAPGAAHKMINANLIIKSVSDDWAHHSENGLIVKELRPYPVWEDFKVLPSSIEMDRFQASHHRKKFINYMLEPLRFTRALLRNAQSILKQIVIR